MGIFNINAKLTQYKINCREHTQRMDDNRLPIKSFKSQTRREKKIGRPQTRWEDAFREEGTDQGAL